MSLLQSTSLTVLALLVGAVTADDQPTKSTKRKVEFGVEETINVEGIVLAVTKDSLLLTPTRKAPITLPAHDCLAAGKVHKLVRGPRSYLLSDLKPGDFVCVDTYVENKQTYCVAIQIYERPGGLVPPPQVIDKKYPYHDCQNAFLAKRDKGTPIPDHLK